MYCSVFQATDFTPEGGGNGISETIYETKICANEGLPMHPVPLHQTSSKDSQLHSTPHLSAKTYMTSSGTP